MLIGHSISMAQLREARGRTVAARLTGLTDGEARHGTTISVTVTGLSGNETVTYQWQQAGIDISGAIEATEVVDIGATHVDNASLRCVVTVDGLECVSDAGRMRYAPITEAGVLPDRTFILGEAVELDLTGGFSLNGNTPTYAITGLPSGLVHNGDGTISGSANTEDQSGVVTIEATDAYGRPGVASTFQYMTKAFSLTQTTDGEIEIDGATGLVTFTISSPSWYAGYDTGNGPGVFTFDSADLASGPINLVPPFIVRTNDADSSGTTNEGDTVGIGDPASDTSYPGLWVYDPDVGGLGAASYQWQADAGGDGNFANLSGATSSAYTLTSGEAGDDVRVQETLADNGGSRTVSSVSISVEASGPVFSDDFSTDTTGNYTVFDGGSLSISGGVMTQDSTRTSFRPNTQPTLNANHRVRATVGSAIPGKAFLYGKFTDFDNCVYVSFRGDSFSEIELFKKIGGSQSKIGDTGFGVYTPQAGDILELEFSNSGNDVTVKLDQGSGWVTYFANTDVSDVPAASGVGWGMEAGSTELDSIEADNI